MHHNRNTQTWCLLQQLQPSQQTLDIIARINFNHRTRLAQLELDQVRQDDEGEYRCRVDFKRGRTVNTIISLRVVIPPDDLSILLAPSSLSSASAGYSNSKSTNSIVTAAGRKLSGLIGPFNEGDELQLICLAHGGKPRPQLSWKRDYNTLDTVGEQNVDKEGRLRSNKELLFYFVCFSLFFSKNTG